MFKLGKFCFRVNNLKHVCSRGVASNALKMINIEETGEGYSVLHMNRAPVNSLNYEFLQELNQAIKTLENEKSCRGAIVTSNLPVFSAGLDLFEMHNPEPERLEMFWKELQTLKLNLLTSPLVLIAAINGACPAGGCAIAFSCDYRIMAEGKHTIGLNETNLGLAAPFWLMESLKLLTGHREAERMLALSILLKPQDALVKGLIDEVVAPEDLLSRSKDEIKKWLAIPDIGRIESKRLVRRNFVEEFQRRRDEDLAVVIKGIENPKLQQVLGMYIEKLKQKK